MVSGKPARVEARASLARNISGILAGADVAVFGEGGVGVDAGRDVGHDPDVVVGGAGGGELGAEPGDLLGGGGVGRGAVAGGVFLGLEDVLEDDEAGVLDGGGEGDGVAAEMGEVAEDGGAVERGEGVVGEAHRIGLEEGAVGVFAIVLAAGVVIAEGEVDGGAGEGFAELEGDEVDGLGGEVGVLGCGGGGGEGVEAAVELVGEEIAGDGGEERVRLLLAGGVEEGLEEGGRGVGAFGVAGGLEAIEVGCLGGGGGSVEDSGPVGGGGGAECGELGGVVEGIEVDVREEEGGDGGCAGAWAEAFVAERGAKESRATRGGGWTSRKMASGKRWVSGGKQRVPLRVYR